MSQVLSNLSKIPHLDETKFTYTFNMFGEGKSESNQTPKFLTASEGISDSPNMFTGKNGFNLSC